MGLTKTLLVALLGAIAAGQGPSDREALAALETRIRRRIQSEDAKVAAWGAYYAGRHGLRGCIPALLDALAVRAARSKRVALREIFLDALIRLEARVPGKVLVDGGFGLARTLILLAPDAKKNEPYLLELHAARQSDFAWWATGAVLASIPSKEFARQLVTSLALRVEVVVVDRGQPTERWRGTSGQRGGRSVRAGGSWPPTDTYGIHHAPRGGARVLVGGFLPVYWSRTSSDAAPPFPDRTDLSLQLLGAMIGKTHASLGLQAQTRLTIPWEGADAYTARLKKLRTRLRGAYDELIEALAAKGLISATQKGALALPLRFDVLDEREDLAEGLPSPPGR